MPGAVAGAAPARTARTPPGRRARIAAASADAAARCRVDKSRGSGQIAAMTNSRPACAHRLAQRLAPAGFVAAHRDGRLWLSYPDNYDSEILPDDSLRSDDEVETTARMLETLADRRALSLAVLRTACELSGYEVDADADGVWALRQGGASSVVSVGWTLTAALREGEPKAVLAGYLRGTGAFLVAGSLLDRAFAMDRIDLCAAPPMTAPRQALPRGEPLPAVSATGAGDDTAMDAWCDRQLQRRRARLKRPWVDYAAEFGALWYRGEGDWITREEVVECAQAGAQASAYPGHALNFLLLLGCEDHRPMALAAWDQWTDAGGGDADSLGFDELAALLYAERADAQDMIHELDNFHVRRAVRAGRFNALHMARAEFLTNLAAFHRCDDDDDERWNAFLDLIEPLVREGLFLLPMFVDPDEMETLHGLTVAMARRPPAEDAWRFVHAILSLAAPLGWKDVAECFVALPRWRNAILDDATGHDNDMSTGCLALSLVCPQIARDAIVRRAFVRYESHSGKRRRYEETADAIAVAWWRCRAAERAASTEKEAGTRPASTQSP